MGLCGKPLRRGRWISRKSRPSAADARFPPELPCGNEQDGDGTEGSRHQHDKGAQGRREALQEKSFGQQGVEDGQSVAKGLSGDGEEIPGTGKTECGYGGG